MTVEGTVAFSFFTVGFEIRKLLLFLMYDAVYLFNWSIEEW